MSCNLIQKIYLFIEFSLYTPLIFNIQIYLRVKRDKKKRKKFRGKMFFPFCQKLPRVVPPGNRWLFSLLSDLGVGVRAVDTGGALGHFRSAGAGFRLPGEPVKREVPLGRDGRRALRPRGAP